MNAVGWSGGATGSVENAPSPGRRRKACFARPYKLLVPREGDHFKAHRDSPKEDGMLGTLAILLPSAFDGGALHVEYRGKKLDFG
ncbi:hypothetical protein BDD12DRAFT_896425 [Trichophaea hybrida]|nr:hypothetical protein BDD12DRAFT_896425 [Trichophaea hybrida]